MRYSSTMIVPALLLVAVLGSAAGFAQVDCHPAPDNLVAWWQGENNAIDAVNFNDGMLFGGAGFAPGKVNTAFSLDGVDAFVEFPNSPDLNPDQQLTVGAWIRPTASWDFGNQPLVTKGFSGWSSPYYQYHLGANGDLRSSGPASFTFWVSTDQGIRLISTADNFWQVGNWYFVVGTYDGAMVKLYVDGNLEAMGALTGMMADYGEPVRVGYLTNGPASAQYLPIDADEIFIADRALDALEIQRIYDAGATGMYLDIAPPTIEVGLAPAGAGDEEDAEEGDDSDEGRFEIRVEVTDDCDATPVVTATLVAEGCGSFDASVGQVIEFEYDDEECESGWEDGVLEIEGPNLRLVVTAEDAAGNSISAEAVPTGLTADNDTEDELDD